MSIALSQKKPPFNPRTHYPASPTDPATWGTYKEALKALSTGFYNGIGYVFTEADPFIGIDLDHCTHLNRRIDKWAQEIISDLSTYTEYSPREGAHMIIKAQAPFSTRKIEGIELFNSGHTLSLTMRSIPGTPTAIEEREEELNKLFSRFDAQRGGEADLHLIWQKPRVTWQREPQQLPQEITKVEERMIERWKREPGNFRRYFEGIGRSGQEARDRSRANLRLILSSASCSSQEPMTTQSRSSGCFTAQGSMIQRKLTGIPVMIL